ncbi:serine hydrolase [Chitinophaga nivalis]|uniref:Serine hydrolase n=1 Tax=Chitinophaga nivalis TaxID=2991709 RepID=A0ABT3IK20_9BACT|nr:serine hydrolase [Chitinophaga nivalis]MCW3466020.1 serine hydrolase [Chitinophaga nivalis]MCW3484289.1 serine hydrolase [Chitinophaga nivalis]
MKKLVCLFLFASQLAFAQDAVPSFVKDSLDNYVTRGLADWQIPGVAVAIVKNGKVVWMKGYGEKATGSAQPVGVHTAFMIGSNTKAFTATALALLQAEKKISLNDKVQRWLPDFTLYDSYIAREANIRDLLSHRLGFDTFQGDFTFFDSDLTSQQIRTTLAKIKPALGFRQWGYCNAGYLTAGEIIPKVTGQSWAAYLKEKIFIPLQMTHTVTTVQELQGLSDKALAHTVTAGKLHTIPYCKIDNLAPAGAISSSVYDMSRWVLLQLNNGKTADRQLIPESVIQALRQPQAVLGNGGPRYNTGHFVLYGLGWIIEEYDGRKIVSHTGGVNGFVSSVTLLPEENLGIVILTNTDNNAFYVALRDEIRDAFLGLPYRNYSRVLKEAVSAGEARQAQLLQERRQEKPTQSAANLPLQAYTGAYQHPVYGGMHITLEKTGLVMHFQHHKTLQGQLEPVGNHEFICTYNASLYGVKLLPAQVKDGKVVSVTVRVADDVETTPYVFVKQ